MGICFKIGAILIKGNYQKAWTRTAAGHSGMYISHLHKLSMPAEVVEARTLNIPARVCIISNKLPLVMQQICRYVD